MTAVRIHTEDMVWNTTMTFGCALVGGATGWVTLKIARHYFNKPTLSNILGFIASTYIPIFAVSYLASRAKIMTFPFDQRFRGFHSLHPLLSVGLLMLSVKVYDKKRERMSVICTLTAIVFLMSIATGIEGKGPGALSLATGTVGTMAAVMPLYSTF